MNIKKIFALGLLGVAGPWSWVGLSAVVHYTAGEPYGQLTFAAPFLLIMVFFIGLAMTSFIPADDEAAYASDRKYGSEV